jgi:hypothetical protein
MDSAAAVATIRRHPRPRNVIPGLIVALLVTARLQGRAASIQPNAPHAADGRGTIGVPAARHCEADHSSAFRDTRRKK